MNVSFKMSRVEAHVLCTHSLVKYVDIGFIVVYLTRYSTEIMCYPLIDLIVRYCKCF